MMQTRRGHICLIQTEDCFTNYVSGHTPKALSLYLSLTLTLAVCDYLFVCVRLFVRVYARARVYVRA